MADPRARSLIFTLEALAWAGCAVVATASLLDTWSADFPARNAALAGESAGLAFSVLAAGVALSRRAGSGTTKALAGIRIVVGVPMMLFWLLVAAAGYAA